MKWALAHLSCSAGYFLKAACSTDKLGPPEYVWPLGDLLMSEAAIIHTFHTFVVSFPWVLLRICQPSYRKIHHSWFFSLHSKSYESERDTQHQTHWSRHFICMITQEEHWVCQCTEKKLTWYMLRGIITYMYWKWSTNVYARPHVQTRPKHYIVQVFFNWV